MSPLWALLLCALLAGNVRAEPVVVGTITLKLGEAWIVTEGGQRRPAAAKAAIHLGEAIETAASGHLHVRFVDGGLIAVRPGSRIDILDYRDPASGGAIRLRLERGIARSITGAWGEANRARFRLNTPIAAIGISGTDFVVQTDALRTRIAVQAGSIVAAPLDDTCRPEGLGPCSGERARVLTAAMGGVMLEIRQGGQAPVLVPRNGLAVASEARRVAEASAVPKQETVTQTTAAKATAAKALAEVDSQPATFAWGRWAYAPAWPGDTLSAPREIAADGRERVAENNRYVLYRLPQQAELPDRGVIGLSLEAAQAHLVQPTGVQPAQVLDGRLNLDFATRRFDTALTLQSQPTGQIPFAASGLIQPDGTFSLIEWQNRVRGAYGVGGSGPSAAYIFERATPQGMFMGITQWR